ncbi:protein of unknown function [Azospirillum baldaniorum]|uniref:Uncharacterized protein n=1 Tax=Azospirillum baldaniorum TaxID=1064539 RepID=A0A9P1JTK0_9PROT|nr:protein of unknown function [Azospirillum baldaniorum]
MNAARSDKQENFPDIHSKMHKISGDST